MAKKFPIKPAHPERVCWGCDKFCAADAMQCGNGSVATPHPSELFGDDWMSWGLDATPQEPGGERPAEARDGGAETIQPR
ncbi:MAG: DUF3079 domain-containing protein [Rhizobacter sp.]|nr:DUF3079 domain-containing protein [Rhizobacter sp.]